jgi:hypothetical protein
MIVLTDERISPECEDALLKWGFETVKLPAYRGLQSPVSAHPDMLLFVGKRKLVCHEKYYTVAKNEIDRAVSVGGLELALTDEAWSDEYPRDVIFNAAPVGEMLICNEKSVSPAVLGLYGKENIINVKQGYSKCAMVTVSDSGIITADPSIVSAAQKNGIDVLKISCQGTKLDGYDTGFIGGASGDDGEHIFFTGDLDSHPDAEKIRDFCRKHGREAVSLGNSALYDYGTLIFI